MADDSTPVTKKTTPRPAAAPAKTGSAARTAEKKPAPRATSARKPASSRAASPEPAVPAAPVSPPASPAAATPEPTPVPPPAAAARGRARAASAARPAVTPEERLNMIKEAAYYLAEHRRTTGQPGDDQQDWVDAERQIDAYLAGEAPSKQA